MDLVDKTDCQELSKFFAESNLSFGDFCRKLIREDVAFKEKVFFMFGESRVLTEVDLVAVDHIFLGESDGSNDLENAWVHYCLGFYNYNLTFKRRWEVII